MRSLTRRLLAGTSATSLALAPLPGAANPLGGQVVGGSASIQGQGTANVTVNQSTNRAIIDWRTFNIAPGETTKFVQPGTSSVTLNRVTGGLGASTIDGTIKANGGVYIVNPDGLLFGPSAKINVGSFLGTTHDIANSDFMAGSNAFTISGNPGASIVNQGSITAAKGGFAALVAPGVRNDGVITANLGTVALASGNAFTLDLYGDSLIKLQAGDSIAGSVRDVATGQTLSSLVTNIGTLRANGGKVALTAVAAKKVVDSVINSSGVVEANTVGTRKGLVVFGAATADTKPAGAPVQTVKVSGKIKTAGRKAGTTGGKIQITGENIQLASAKLNASGKAGGGTILVGGDIQGGSPRTTFTNPRAVLESTPVPQASTVSVDSGSVLDASATGSGSGGKVVVWANDETRFFGKALATGGPAGGDGGFVEISSPKVLTLAGTVDVTASKGSIGTAFFDPDNAYVVANLPACATSTGCGSNSYIAASTLSPGGTVSGNIVTVNAPVAATGSLAFFATSALNVNAPISTTGSLTLNSSGSNTLLASVSGDGGVTISAGTTLAPTPAITSVAGAVLVTAPVIDFSAPISGYAGVTINAGTSLAPTPAITSSIGVISITAPDINLAGNLSAGPAVSLNASNSISINAPLSVTGSVAPYNVFIRTGYYGQNSNITAPVVTINAPIAFNSVVNLNGSYQTGLDLNASSLLTGAGSISVAGGSSNFSLPSTYTASGPWAFTNSVVSLTTAGDTVALPPGVSLTSSTLNVISNTPKTITLSGGYSQDANSALTCSTGCFQTININQASVAGPLSAGNINVGTGASLANATLNASNAIVFSGSNQTIGDNVSLSAESVTLSSPSLTTGNNFTANAAANIDVNSTVLNFGEGVLLAQQGLPFYTPAARITAGNQINFNNDVQISGGPSFTAGLIAGSGRTLTVSNTAALYVLGGAHMVGAGATASFNANEIDPSFIVGNNTAFALGGLSSSFSTTAPPATPVSLFTTIAGNISTGANSFVSIGANNLQLNGNVALGPNTSLFAGGSFTAIINGSLTAAKNTSAEINGISLDGGGLLLINNKLDFSNLVTSSDATPYFISISASGIVVPAGFVGPTPGSSIQAGPNGQIIGGVGPIQFSANTAIGAPFSLFGGFGPIPVTVQGQQGPNLVNLADCVLVAPFCGGGGTTILVDQPANITGTPIPPTNGAFFDIILGSPSSSVALPPVANATSNSANTPTAANGLEAEALQNPFSLAAAQTQMPTNLKGSTLLSDDGTVGGILDNYSNLIQENNSSGFKSALNGPTDTIIYGEKVASFKDALSVAGDIYSHFYQGEGYAQGAATVDLAFYVEQLLLANSLGRLGPAGGVISAIVVTGQKDLGYVIIGAGRLIFSSH